MLYIEHQQTKQRLAQQEQLVSDIDDANNKTEELSKLIDELQSKIDEITQANIQLQEQIKKLEEEKAEIEKAKNLGTSTGASSFKCYMDYGTITNKSSSQYKLQQMATTDENGLRKIGDYYCVAMGTYYGEVGDTFYIETDEGACWKVILADIKSDKHTNSTHQYTRANGCMMEFIVDTSELPSSIRNSGTVNALGFQGNITVVKKL